MRSLSIGGRIQLRVTSDSEAKLVWILRHAAPCRLVSNEAIRFAIPGRGTPRHRLTVSKAVFRIRIDLLVGTVGGISGRLMQEARFVLPCYGLPNFTTRFSTVSAM